MQEPYYGENDDVSPLHSLLCAIFPCGDWCGRLMAKLSAFSAYFDASGHPSDQPFVVVSGFVANAHQWLFFNKMWEAIHKRYDIALPFHAADFAGRYRQYKKWSLDDPEAEDFASELASAQQIYMLFGVSCVVDMGDYRQLSEVFQLGQMVPAFALGARACISLLEKWQAFANIEYPIECVFEDGDFGRGKFIEIMRTERMPAPIFKNKGDFPGLQAADHVAWEQGNHLKKQRTGNPVSRTPTFNQLLAIPHMHMQTTVESLLNVCEKKGIKVKGKIIIP